MANLKTKMIDDVLIVGFGQSKLLDETVIKEVGDQLVQTITEAAESKKILLTFHGVQFMSSAMLGKLVIFNKKCAQAGIELKVCRIPDSIMEVFKITKMNKAFDIYKQTAPQLEEWNKRSNLLLVSLETGKVEKSIPLSFAPVWDGMAVAQGRLFISGKLGKIYCYE